MQERIARKTKYAYSSPIELSETSTCRREDQNNKTVLIKILKKSKELQSYKKNGTDQDMKYFNVIGASGSTIYRLKIYQVHILTMIREGMSYKFANCAEKPDGLWVVSGTSIGYVKPVEVDPTLLVPNLPEEEPPTGTKRTLQQALQSPQRSTVKAKIVKVSPVKFRREGSLPVRCLGLKDNTGYAKVALFANLAEQAYEENSTIELTGVYQKRHLEKSQLAVTRDTTCQYVTDDIDVNLESADIDYFLKDGDICIPDDATTKLTVDTITDVITYNGCKTPGCRLKKLRDGVCPNCEGQDGKETFYAKLSIVGHQLEKEFTLFQANVEKLFGKQNPSDDIIPAMVELLPIEFTAKICGNNLYNITKSD